MMKRLAATLLAYLIAIAPALATGPGTVVFPNATAFGVTFGAGGEYHTTGALVDINNPANGATISGGSLQVTVQNSPSVTISGTPAVSVSGTANVNCTSGCSSSSFADEAAFTQGTTGVSPIAGLFSNSITNLTTGQAGALQATNDRMLFVNLGKVGGSAVALGQTTMAASLPVAIASNQGNVPVNNAQVSGTAVSVNSGTKDAGTQRIVIATDQPALTNPLLVTVNNTPNIGTHTAASFLDAAGTNGFTTAPFTVLTTELNALASAGIATSSVNGTSGKFSQTDTGNAIFGRCWVTLGAALGGAATAGANFSVWFLTSTDGGTTFESTTVSPPPRSPDLIIPVGANAYATNAVLMSPPRQSLWSETVKIVFQNNTGQAMGASGNTMKCGPQATVN